VSEQELVQPEAHCDGEDLEQAQEARHGQVSGERTKRREKPRSTQQTRRKGGLLMTRKCNGRYVFILGQLLTDLEKTFPRTDRKGHKE
jgi:hypothetical protein